MLNILLFASAIIINTPNPQPPQPKKPVTVYNKEGLIDEDKRSVDIKKKEKEPNNHKSLKAHLNNKTKVKVAQSNKHHNSKLH